MNNNELFHLVPYNGPGIVHCTYQGVTGQNCQIKINFSRIIANSTDSDEMLFCGISSGSSLFAKVPDLRVSCVQRVK